jgi:hypothetical protein
MNEAAARFHNALLILHSIDAHNLKEAGICDENWGTPEASPRDQIGAFIIDPVMEALRMPDANFERLFAYIESRQPASRQPPASEPPPPAPELHQQKPIERFWMVWNIQKSASPTHKHKDKTSASTEGKRLAALSPAQLFVILEAVDAFISPVLDPQAVGIIDPKPIKPAIDPDDIPF